MSVAFISSCWDPVISLTVSTIKLGRSKICPLFSTFDVNSFHPANPVFFFSSTPASIRSSFNDRSVRSGWFGKENMDAWTAAASILAFPALFRFSFPKTSVIPPSAFITRSPSSNRVKYPVRYSKFPPCSTSPYTISCVISRLFISERIFSFLCNIVFSVSSTGTLVQSLGGACTLFNSAISKPLYGPRPVHYRSLSHRG